MPRVALVLFLVLASLVDAATPLSPQPAADGRVIRLDHAQSPQARGHLVLAALVPTGGRHVDLYMADNDAAPFRALGRITDPVFATGACCGTLYELPRAVGGLPEGTLLWATSTGNNTPDKHMAIRIYRSDDAGRNWTFSSEVHSPLPGQIWEPEFSVARDGALALFYSDETQPRDHSQLIRKVRTYDGAHWQDFSEVIASRIQRDRPGMPVTRTLRDGRWMMTYELCGPARCIARYRLSQDGWNWGDPTEVGAEIRLPNGAFPAHAPRFTVTPEGRILLVGQIIETPQLQLGERNGRVLLVNDAGDPTTPWRTIPAPVPVLDACSETCKEHQWCPNYSSSLLTARDGGRVLEVASDWRDNACFSSYGWGPAR
jgi:hypothetical protein